MVVSGQIASVKAYSEPDAQEIYRALMAPYKRPILVLSTTIDEKTCSVSEKEIKDPEFRKAMATFHEVNEQVWDLSKVLGNRRTINNVELDEIFKPGLVEGWKQFRQKYPDSSGYVSLSAVGFNDAHTVAVVYSAGHCAVNCAAGGLQYFRRTPKGWQRVETGFPNCHWFS
jgi:hypothetical protein